MSNAKTYAEPREKYDDRVRQRRGEYRDFAIELRRIGAVDTAARLDPVIGEYDRYLVMDERVANPAFPIAYGYWFAEAVRECVDRELNAYFGPLR